MFKAKTLETQIQKPETPLEKEAASLGPWFHNLHLNGIQTAPNHPLGDFPKFKWEQICKYIPQDLNNWKILDVGCNAGYYSFEIAKRGGEVVGIDIDEHYLRQASWAAEIQGLEKKTTFKKMQVYEISMLNEVFDLILFMGVFYHLRYPLLALDIIAGKFSKLLLFQTMTMPEEEIFNVPDNISIEQRYLMLLPGWPRMAFIEKYLSGDETNWWAPNSAAVEAMLRSAGLKITAKPAHEIYLCEKEEKTKLFNTDEITSALKGITNFNENI